MLSSIKRQKIILGIARKGLESLAKISYRKHHREKPCCAFLNTMSCSGHRSWKRLWTKIRELQTVQGMARRITRGVEQLLHSGDASLESRQVTGNRIAAHKTHYCTEKVTWEQIASFSQCRN